MLTLNIGHKYWHIVEKGRTFPVLLGWNEAYDKLSPVSWTYDELVKLGYEGEQIIELLVKKYLGWRMFRVGILATREYCQGLIGARGSGKSCGAAMTSFIDFMLRLVPVYSNMPIEARVVYKKAEKVYRSEEIEPEKMLKLDQLYRDACLTLDEPNIEYGVDAYRSTGIVPLAFDYALQQMRKVNLSIIYAVQSDMFVTKRMRFQTDVYTQCWDASAGTAGKIPRGHKSKLHSHDYSGLITGHSYYTGKEPMTKRIVNIRPWWSLYDTGKVQTREKDYKQYTMTAAQMDKMQKQREYWNLSSFIFNSCVNSGVESISSEDLWTTFNIPDKRSQRTYIGMELSKMGVTKTESRSGFCYHFPAAENI